MKRFLVSGLVSAAVMAGAFSPAPSVGGDPFEDGLAAYQVRDYATALRLWEPLAQGGHVDAQVNLGVMYTYGKGVPRDYATAITWFSRAAERGDAYAQRNLGFLYVNGHGVPRNFKEAEKWFRRAAAQGDAKALNNLGLMFSRGEGVPEDYVQAYKWFSLSASYGFPNAATARDLIAQHMSAEEIAEAQRLAREWRPE